MRPKVIAKVLLVNDAGELLCLTRSKHDDARPGEWDFPGGNLQTDESPIAAIRREVAEETGLTVREPQLVFATTAMYNDKALIFLFFVDRVVGRPQVVLSEDHEAAEWLTLEALRAKPDFPAFHEALEFASRHKLLSA